MCTYAIHAAALHHPYVAVGRVSLTWADIRGNTLLHLAAQHNDVGLAHVSAFSVRICDYATNQPTNQPQILQHLGPNSVNSTRHGTGRGPAVSLLYYWRDELP